MSIPEHGGSGSADDFPSGFRISPLARVFAAFLLGVALAPVLLNSAGLADFGTTFLVWLYLALFTLATCLDPRIKHWLKRNLLWMLTLLISVSVFVGVPQVRYVWYSQTPDSLSDGRAVWWIPFTLVAALIGLFFSLSVYVVPRQIRPVASDAGWIRRRLLAPLDAVISWPVAVRNRIGKFPAVLAGLCLLFAGICLWMIAPPADATLIASVPLSGALWQHVAFGVVAFGLWLALSGAFVLDEPETDEDLKPDGRYILLMTTGRLLGWFVLVHAVNEILWFACAADMIEFMTLRIYALWGITTWFMLGIVIAGCLDYLDLHVPRIPVRLIGLLCIAVAVLTIRPSANTEVQLQPCVSPGYAPLNLNDSSFREPLLKPAVFSAGSEQPPDVIGEHGKPLVDAWQHLEMKIRSVPPSQPVVLVAASGGGSRAAIFASLVYECLARTTVPEFALDTSADAAVRPRRTWADNIVLMSSVSGGSLATAHFAHRKCTASEIRPALRHSVLQELAGDTQEQIKKLLATAYRQRADRQHWQATEDRAMKILDALDHPAQNHPDIWVLRNAFTDDMCTNFMAPILRGALAMSLFRGQALGSFWEHTFGWARSSNIAGYESGAGDRAAGYDPAVHPVVLYNTCEVASGARVTVAFPPLPADAFAPPVGNHRFPPQELAVVHPDYRVGVRLSRAVRFSANFPWGFYPVEVDIPAIDADDKRIQLLDGGVTDNTGIDSVYEVLNGLAHPIGEAEMSGTPETSSAEVIRRRLLRLLRSRTVVLLEIDSGAKPAPAGGLARFVEVVFGPVQALSNAGYCNAEVKRTGYIRGMEDLLTPNEGSLSASRPQASNAARRRKFFHYAVRCNHFSRTGPAEPEVMTAWALSTQQKANVIARFVMELYLLEKQLKGFAQSAELLYQEQLLRDELKQQNTFLTNLLDSMQAHTEESMRLAETLKIYTQNSDSRRPSPLTLQSLNERMLVLRNSLKNATDAVSRMSTQNQNVRAACAAALENWRRTLQVADNQWQELRNATGNVQLPAPNVPEIAGKTAQFVPSPALSNDEAATADPQRANHVRQNLDDVIRRSIRLQQSLEQLDHISKGWFDDTRSSEQ